MDSPPPSINKWNHEFDVFAWWTRLGFAPVPPRSLHFYLTWLGWITWFNPWKLQKMWSVRHVSICLNICSAIHSLSHRTVNSESGPTRICVAENHPPHEFESSHGIRVFDFAAAAAAAAKNSEQKIDGNRIRNANKLYSIDSICAHASTYCSLTFLFLHFHFRIWLIAAEQKQIE